MNLILDFEQGALYCVCESSLSCNVPQTRLSVPRKLGLRFAENEVKYFDFIPLTTNLRLERVNLLPNGAVGFTFSTS